jgi:hypothetical protein
MGGLLVGCDEGVLTSTVVPRVKVQRVAMNTFSPQVTLMSAE